MFCKFWRESVKKAAHKATEHQLNGVFLGNYQP